MSPEMTPRGEKVRVSSSRVKRGGTTRPTAVLRLVVAAGLAFVPGVRAAPTDEVEIVWREAQKAGVAFPDPNLADASAGCSATTGVARSGGVLLSLR